MTYLGHVAFRQLLNELGGCGLMFSEMCSAAKIPHENRHCSSYFKWRDEEAAGLVLQIVGSDPERMACAAERIQAEGFFGVDINLGCSVKEICRYSQGAALLKTPDLAVQIVRQVRRRVSFPVTVKFRTGWREDPQIPVDLARRLEDAGADALTFHPRLAPDRRTRPPRWAYIGLVKQAVAIPVFGNGDVFSAEDCLRMLETTGCDGVALGRIAIARPWVFAQWRLGTDPPETILEQCALRLLALIQHHFDEMRGLRRFKRYATYLAANFTFGNSLYNHLRKAADFKAIKRIMETFFESRPHRLKRPNLNFLR
jgi:nifR3 family TIM-barrel protein